MSTEPTGLLAVADIVDVLEALCTCEGEAPRCTYCDARLEIEEQRRVFRHVQSDYTRLRAVARAARDLVAEVDRKHETLAPYNPLRYTTPWGKLTKLRKALDP